MRLEGLLLVAVLTAAAPAWADAAADAAAIRGAARGMGGGVQRRDAGPVGDLFADDLVSVVPDAPNAGKAEVCARLARVLARDDVRFAYRPEIDEVLVWGDHAAVRLDWVLTPKAARPRRAGSGDRPLPPRPGWRLADHPIHRFLLGVI